MWFALLIIAIGSTTALDRIRAASLL